MDLVEFRRKILSNECPVSYDIGYNHPKNDSRKLFRLLKNKFYRFQVYHFPVCKEKERVVRPHNLIH